MAKRKKKAKPTQAQRWLATGLTALFVSVGVLLWWQTSNRSSSEPTAATMPTRRALIADQLGHYHPNPEFVREATAMLEAAGYAVEYLPTEAITVDFYRRLPLRGDDLILLRAHGTVSQYNRADGSTQARDFVSLASGERIPEDLVFEDPFQLLAAQEGWLERFTMLDENSNPDESGVFLITQGFFTYAMEGEFNDSVLVLMGCDGLRGSATAEHFVQQRGARAVVGWDGEVSARHMDDATLHWLQHYLQDSSNPALLEAVQDTQQRFGPDPFFAGELQLMLRSGEVSQH